jgi:proline iminopeptidase
MRRALLTGPIAIMMFAANLSAQTARPAGHAAGSGGVSIYYEVVGTGPDTVLFVHGTPSTMYTLARDFGELERDFTLVFFDQRGGGRSQLVLAADSLRWEDHVADMEALRHHLGIGRMHLFGLSWGAVLTVHYADRHPDRVDRLVLLPMRARRNPDAPTDPEPLPPAPDSATRQRLEELIREWSLATDPVAVCEEYWRLQLPFFFARPERVSRLRGSFCEEPPEVLRHSWTVSAARMASLGAFDVRPVLAGIEAPTLIMKGTATTMYRAWTEEWARAMPNSRMMLVDDSGLMPWIEQPAFFFPAVRQFLNGDWPAAARTIR